MTDERVVLVISTAGVCFRPKARKNSRLYCQTVVRESGTRHLLGELTRLTVH